MWNHNQLAILYSTKSAGDSAISLPLAVVVLDIIVVSCILTCLGNLNQCQ